MSATRLIATDDACLILLQGEGVVGVKVAEQHHTSRQAAEQQLEKLIANPVELAEWVDDHRLCEVGIVYETQNTLPTSPDEPSGVSKRFALIDEGTGDYTVVLNHENPGGYAGLTMILRPNDLYELVAAIHAVQYNGTYATPPNCLIA